MPTLSRLVCLLSLSLAAPAIAHDSDSVPGQPLWFLAQNTTPRFTPSSPVKPAATDPVQASVFQAFSPAVQVRWDHQHLYVESNGMPAHPMMTGITAWQQQVPLPQPYTGANAWQIPLHPVPAQNPRSIHNQFLRGAIALAANGIPIFNPQNNRGEISAQIGELDRWGGHCGRADDYHYHAAPLHLESVVGKGKPIAYALDGYPILGTTELNGTPPSGLDSFHGHSHGTIGYHYHASLSYPYVNGGFHGEVIERDGQVDPQPRANPVRPALQALRGATITGHHSVGANAYRLTYELGGQTYSISYAVQPDGTYPFEFHSPKADPVREVYSARKGPGPEPEKPDRKDRGKGPRRVPEKGDPGSFQPNPPPPPGPPDRRREPSPEPAPFKASPNAQTSLQKPLKGFALRSPEIPADGTLPAEFTGEGAGISPPLEWSGAPDGTTNYVLTMHHVDPEGRVKCYWILTQIPGSTKQLPKNSRSIGTFGLNSINRRNEYAPPHSKGPGLKSYTLTLYALSKPFQLPNPGADLESLQTALQANLLATADLPVHFTRSLNSDSPQDPPPKKPGTRTNPK